MLKQSSLQGFRRPGAALALGACLALLSACSSDDKRPLLQVNLTLGVYPVAVTTVTIAATASDIQLASMSVSPNLNGQYGLYLPDGTSGAVTVYVSIQGPGNCVLASGTVAGVAVKPGEKTPPFEVPLIPTGDLCLGDAGVPDTAPPASEVGAALDTGLDGLDSAMAEVTPPPLDGAADAGPDTRTPDAVSPEVTTIDAAADQAPGLEGGADRPGDVPIGNDAADAPAQLDTQPDGGEAGPTTMNVFRNCLGYTHSELTSPDAAADWGIRQLAFSPDGKYLVSVGEDARIRVWNVTPAGLSPLVKDFVFPGGRQNPVAAFSPDGKYLAVGHGYDVAVTVYDFAASVEDGAAAIKWFIPASLAPSTAYSVERVQFTTDLGHLVAFYRGDTGETNALAVWELASTPTIKKQATYPHEETVYGIIPAAYPGPVTVASAAVVSADGGYQTTITVTDIVAIPASKAQATLSGSVDQMAFTPDGASVVVGLSDTGEVSRWNVIGTNLVRQQPPLIPESSAGSADNFDFAITLDGKYLAAATDDWSSVSVKLVAMAQNETSRTKSTAYIPWSVAFAPSGLALAVGERDFGVILYCTP